MMDLMIVKEYNRLRRSTYKKMLKRPAFINRSSSSANVDENSKES